MYVYVSFWFRKIFRICMHMHVLSPLSLSQSPATEEKTEEQAIAEHGGPLHLPSPHAVTWTSWRRIVQYIL